MPWPAVVFSKIYQQEREIDGSDDSGMNIPGYMLLDSSGKVLARTDGTMGSTDKFLVNLEALLAHPTTLATSR